MKNYQLLILLFFSLGIYGQNSKDFFPPVNDSIKHIAQKIRIETDTTEYIYMTYEFQKSGLEEFLISCSFDTDSILSTYLKEKITKKGLKFEEGYLYQYDDQMNRTDITVKASKKITYPFKPIDKIEKWKVVWKSVHDNKIITKSKITCLGLDAFYYENENIETLLFEREVGTKYKRNFTKRKKYYTYYMSFTETHGLVHYTRAGYDQLKGTVVNTVEVSDN